MIVDLVSYNSTKETKPKNKKSLVKFLKKIYSIQLKKKIFCTNVYLILYL